MTLRKTQVAYGSDHDTALDLFVPEEKQYMQIGEITEIFRDELEDLYVNVKKNITKCVNVLYAIII